MTKKRFIKLLMSHGESIHRARAIAFLYNSNNIPYKKAYNEYLIKYKLKNAFSQLGKAIARVGEACKMNIKLLGKLGDVINDTIKQRNNAESYRHD